MNKITLKVIISLLILAPVTAWPLNIEKRWGDAKDTMDDEVYMDHRITLYCGCDYISKNNNSGGGSMTAESCQITNKPGPSQSSVRIDIVLDFPISHPLLSSPKTHLMTLAPIEVHTRNKMTFRSPCFMLAEIMASAFQFSQ